MEKARVELRSLEQVNAAREDLYNKTINTEIDPRVAMIAERMLQGATRLNIELPIRYGILIGRHKGDRPPVQIPWLKTMQELPAIE